MVARRRAGAVGRGQPYIVAANIRIRRQAAETFVIAIESEPRGERCTVAEARAIYQCVAAIRIDERIGRYGESQRGILQRSLIADGLCEHRCAIRLHMALQISRVPRRAIGKRHPLDSRPGRTIPVLERDAVAGRRKR